MRNQRLSKFLAARYLDISVIDFEKMVQAGVIKPIGEDHLGVKFLEQDLHHLKKNGLKPNDLSLEKTEASPPKTDIPKAEDLLKRVFKELPELSPKGEYIRIDVKDLQRYNSTALYSETATGMTLYKPRGKALGQERLAGYKIPYLYVHKSQYLEAIVEVQKSLITELEETICRANLPAVISNVSNLFSNALMHPESSSLKELIKGTGLFTKEGLGTMEDVVKVFKELEADNSLAAHSVTTMTLAINFGRYSKLSEEEIGDLANAGLLLDIGFSSLQKKGESDIKKHCEESMKILKDETDLTESILTAIGEHHERVDGSGILGQSNISEMGQIIGLLAEFTIRYKALRHTPPLEILKSIQEEVKEGRFSQELFQKFILSLA